MKEFTLKLSLPVSETVYEAVRECSGNSSVELDNSLFPEIPEGTEIPEGKELIMYLPDTEEAKQLFLSLVKLSTSYGK